MHSEGYRLFAGFWWLIFPIGWGIAGMMRAFLRHKRAEQALEVVKTYANQGKEIPPELLEILRQPEKGTRAGHDRKRVTTLVGLIFMALALAFTALTIGHYYLEGDHDIAGLVFVIVLMSGLSAAFLITSRLGCKDNKSLDGP